MSFNDWDGNDGSPNRCGRIYLGPSNDRQYVDFSFFYSDVYSLEQPTEAEVDAKFQDFADYIRAYPGAAPGPGGQVAVIRRWSGPAAIDQVYPSEAPE